MPPHPSTNFEIKEYYDNEPKFNGVYLRDNLPETIHSKELGSAIKKGAYVINLDEYADIGTHWVALYVKSNKVIYFDSYGGEHIPKEVKNFIGNREIKANIFRLQAYDSIMCGYFCIEFINFMLNGKSLTDYTSLFSPHDFKKNDKIITSLFK